MSKRKAASQRIAKLPKAPALVADRAARGQDQVQVGRLVEVLRLEGAVLEECLRLHEEARKYTSQEMERFKSWRHNVEARFPNAGMDTRDVKIRVESFPWTLEDVLDLTDKCIAGIREHKEDCNESLASAIEYDNKLHDEYMARSE